MRTLNPVSAGRLLRMISLRMYARCPIRVATLSRLTFGQAFSAREEPVRDGVYAIEAGDHKTSAVHGPAHLFVYEEEIEMLIKVSTLTLPTSLRNKNDVN